MFLTNNQAWGFVCSAAEALYKTKENKQSYVYKTIEPFFMVTSAQKFNIGAYSNIRQDIKTKEDESVVIVKSEDFIKAAHSDVLNVNFYFDEKPLERQVRDYLFDEWFDYVCPVDLRLFNKDYLEKLGLNHEQITIIETASNAPFLRHKPIKITPNILSRIQGAIKRINQLKADKTFCEDERKILKLLSFEEEITIASLIAFYDLEESNSEFIAKIIYIGFELGTMQQNIKLIDSLYEYSFDQFLLDGTIFLDQQNFFVQ